MWEPDDTIWVLMWVQLMREPEDLMRVLLMLVLVLVLMLVRLVLVSRACSRMTCCLWSVVPPSH